jgi:arginine deiminase
LLPGLAHKRLTPNNCDELLFDDVIWVDQAKRDHFDFVTKMRERGVDVLEMHNLLTDIVAIPKPWTGSSTARSPPTPSAWA